ncbi:MAG: hypothetical protein H6799_01305 [Candidatus Nomurabacteria bacterium]|mgnify:CR=1 FL=1|nr:MAG: hypothetical protein H6799_01305 [Candidatus Nomurabacteria bacterium]HRV75927.1 hypothetical protein [Candidatus Saccharimonadales bacterium]
METREGRELVRELVGSDDVILATGDFLDRASREPGYRSDPNYLAALKIAEYALLVDPIEKGIQSVLFSQWDGISDLMDNPGLAEQIRSVVGEDLYAAIFINIDPVRLGVMEEISEKRSLFIPAYEKRYKAMVCPFSGNLRAASMNAVSSACTSAWVALKILQKSDEGRLMTKEEQLETVLRSPGLYIARQSTHLKDLPVVSSMIERVCESTLDEFSLSKYVSYNPVLKRVVLNAGFAEWVMNADWSPQLIKERLSGQVDVTLGCPFTFVDRELRLEFYRKMVNLLYNIGAWPKLSEW